MATAQPDGVGAGVVIAGGGLAAQRCAETLRRLGYEGRVRMVCAEPHLPYDRPPLSKAALRDPAAAESIGFRSADWYQDKVIEALRGVAASGLDAAAHRVALSDGSTLHYEQLVIATGAKPRMLAAFAGYENVGTLRTLEDSRAPEATSWPMKPAPTISRRTRAPSSSLIARESSSVRSVPTFS